MPDPVRMTDDDLLAGYATVADDYVTHIHRELEHKPLDRALLAGFAARVRGRGRCLDLGCGPGHVTTFLAGLGVDITGIDLSPAMIDRARALDPDRTFVVGDMRALALPDRSAAGAVAMYSIVHFTPGELPAVFVETARVLVPGAPLLVAFHIGADRVHLADWWGHAVAVDFQFFDPVEVTAALRSAGFRMLEHTEREPYPDVEYPSQRAYLLAEAD